MLTDTQKLAVAKHLAEMYKDKTNQAISEDVMEQDGVTFAIEDVLGEQPEPEDINSEDQLHKDMDEILVLALKTIGKTDADIAEIADISPK
jgi:hypothetical protein